MWFKYKLANESHWNQALFALPHSFVFTLDLNTFTSKRTFLHLHLAPKNKLTEEIKSCFEGAEKNAGLIWLAAPTFSLFLSKVNLC